MEWRNRVYCGDLTRAQSGDTVFLMGWVDAIRDHGNVLFIHLRDVSGIIQIVFNPNMIPGPYEMAADLKEEYVVSIRGKVAKRAAGTENPNLKTGDVEVFASEISILSRQKTFPF